MAEAIRNKRPERIRLGDLLVQQKLISQEQLRGALEDQGRSGRKLGRVLIESGYLSEDQIGEALARQLGVPFINLKYYNFNSAVTRKLPEAQARRFRALLLEEQDDMVLVAMVDPTDLFAFDEISRLTRKEVNIAVVSETLLLQTVDRIYRRTDQITSLAKELGEDLGDIVDLGTLTLGAEDAPVVKLLQTMFEDAIQARASDIHIEPHEKGLHIRFRIDGLLQPQTETDAKISSAVAQRLKLMSGLDISERRLPQDGRFNVKVREQQIDVRISSMPTQYGETIVMRLLHRAGGLHQLDDLGMSPEMLERFGKAIHRYTGMVLVTGPTGSGKTTTLYAALNELNKPDCKIITVEDPVEYRLDGLNQVQVNDKIELTFGRVLRSSLRQDPDVILIGEMRDLETAEIGLRAAITGHMVLSTLHTRDAASAPLRLLRVNCESCRKPYQPGPQEAQWLRSVGCDPAAGRIMAGSGCQHCNASGYAGRIGIYEMLEMDNELATLANSDDPGHFIAAAEQRMAGQLLRDSAAQLALAGKTTVSEAMRVTAQIED